MRLELPPPLRQHVLSEGSGVALRRRPRGRHAASARRIRRGGAVREQQAAVNSVVAAAAGRPVRRGGAVREQQAAVNSVVAAAADRRARRGGAVREQQAAVNSVVAAAADRRARRGVAVREQQAPVRVAAAAAAAAAGSRRRQLLHSQLLGDARLLALHGTLQPVVVVRAVPARTTAAAPRGHPLSVGRGTLTRKQKQTAKRRRAPSGGRKSWPGSDPILE